MNNKPLSVVKQQNILGLYVSSDLKWTFIYVKLPRKLTSVVFYCKTKTIWCPGNRYMYVFWSSIRPLLRNCSHVFHHFLLEYLSEDLENVQKGTLAISSPNVLYENNLRKFHLCSMNKRRSQLGQKLFCPSSLASTGCITLFPDPRVDLHNFRKKRVFGKCEIIRFLITFFCK